MGLLKRFFSLRHKARRKRTRSDADSKNNLPDAVLPRCSESDAAFSRLLRSSSTHFKIIHGSDVTSLKPLPPRPSDCTSTRSSSTLGPYSSNSAQASSISKSTYSVTVYKRQQLSSTEFPNAYPPVTPHRPSGASRSTPNLLTLPGGSTGNLTGTTDNDDASVTATLLSVPDPLKYPVTPRDVGRLNNLRLDPSVVSLVGMYDETGKLNENAFTNTPAKKRKSLKNVFDINDMAKVALHENTFKDLLGGDSNNDADLSWAERYIANNESMSSLSSTPTPPLYSSDPDAERKSSDSTSSSKVCDGISSMIVELSVTSEEPKPEIKETGLMKQPVDLIEDNMTFLTKSDDTQKDNRGMERRPSQRASQVFRFISERRDRRKSQELLGFSGSSNLLLINEEKGQDGGRDGSLPSRIDVNKLSSNPSNPQRLRRRSLSSIESPSSSSREKSAKGLQSSHTFSRSLGSSSSSSGRNKQASTIVHFSSRDQVIPLAHISLSTRGDTTSVVENSEITVGESHSSPGPSSGQNEELIVKTNETRVRRSLSTGAQQVLSSGLTEADLDWTNDGSFPYTSTPHQNKISRDKLVNRKSRSSSVTGAIRPPISDRTNEMRLQNIAVNDLNNHRSSAKKPNLYNYSELEDRTYRIFVANLDATRKQDKENVWHKQPDVPNPFQRRQAKPTDRTRTQTQNASELPPEAIALMVDSRSRNGQIQETRERRTKGVQREF